jgi:hypothetical protein
MHLQHKFEHYMRHELPIRLNLSPSKQVACEMIFHHFSDSVKGLSDKAPEEFRQFFEALKEYVDKVSKWRCPKTHVVAPKVTGDKDGLTGLAKTADGKLLYTLYEKPEK